VNFNFTPRKEEESDILGNFPKPRRAASFPNKTSAFTVERNPLNIGEGEVALAFFGGKKRRGGGPANINCGEGKKKGS